jgi:hypothetical protein
VGTTNIEFEVVHGALVRAIETRRVKTS